MRTLELSSSSWPVKKISWFVFFFHSLLLAALRNASAPGIHLFPIRDLKGVCGVPSPQKSGWLFTLGTFPSPGTRRLGCRSQGSSSHLSLCLFTHTCVTAPGWWEFPRGCPPHLCFQFLPGRTNSQNSSCRIYMSPGIPAVALEQWGTAHPQTSSIPGLRDKAQGNRDRNLKQQQKQQSRCAPERLAPG